VAVELLMTLVLKMALQLEYIKDSFPTLKKKAVKQGFQKFLK
jgi:hypothetical protein